MSYFDRYDCDVCKKPATRMCAYKTKSHHLNFILCDDKDCRFKADLKTKFFKFDSAFAKV